MYFLSIKAPALLRALFFKELKHFLKKYVYRMIIGRRVVQLKKDSRLLSFSLSLTPHAAAALEMIRLIFYDKGATSNYSTVYFATLIADLL